ncbi:hypothetical protein WICPIJ_004020 [Wickerhamomyces pijperi]|uniref:RING-type E3 ubiquitin transferase n=1 Tax=Wickerhamomyces pijperi TaxID=599730 RepID=A0A9P8Q6F7_WICPI|nr:hypothetical protein WICPIJ_004020 [Wickerhamomyces pijperi]
MNTSHQEPASPSCTTPPTLGQSRRRTSSFNFFSNITNSLRSSSSNLATNSNSSSTSNLPGSLLALNNDSNNNLTSPARSRATSSSSRVPPVNISQRISNSNPSNTGLNEDLYSSTPIEDSTLQTRGITLQDSTQVNKTDSEGNYSIRLTPFIDHSSNIPALYFSPILRKVKPDTNLTIGRYTDKVKEAVNAPQNSILPLVFKSKVVSRTHAVFSVNRNGDWFIRDLKSSSGTFLNHIRLSPAGVESMDMQLTNGDVLQLGMDFRGGIEDIFRCVKMKVELNKSWQRKARRFNKEIHERLTKLALTEDQEQESECAICLSELKPCQAMFVSPCSHCWHYKCIRPILIKSYPQFLCPNCRETCDLEEDFDDEELSDDDEEEEVEEPERTDNEEDASPTSADTDDAAQASGDNIEIEESDAKIVETAKLKAESS